MRMRPSENFTGADGSRLRAPSCTQIDANTGAKMMMNSGLMVCSVPAAMSQPNTLRTV